MEKIHLLLLEPDDVSQIIRQREYTYNLVKKLLEVYPKQSDNYKRLEGLRDSTFIAYASTSKKETPLECYFSKSRFDFTWSAIAKSIIISKWNEYSKQKPFTNTSTLKFRVNWTRPVKQTLDAFKTIRQRPSWKRTISGGQFMIEPCLNHYNVHCLLLHKASLQSSIHSLISPIGDNIALAPGEEFLRAIELSTIKKLNNVDSKALMRFFDELNQIEYIYKFGSLHEDKQLDYSLNVNDLLPTNDDSLVKMALQHFVSGDNCENETYVLESAGFDYAQDVKPFFNGNKIK